VERRVAPDIDRDVAKVPLVRQAVAAADAGPAVAVDIPGEPDPWRKVVPVALPERADRALVRWKHRPPTDGVDDLLRSTSTHRHVRIGVVEVGVVLRIALFLRAVILVTQAKIERQAVHDAPVVLSVERELVVA